MPYTAAVTRVGNRGQVGHKPTSSWGGLVTVTQATGQTGKQR